MFGVTNGVISMIFLPLMVLYAAYILKRLYQLSFAQMLLRTLIFCIVLGVVFAIIIVIVIIIMLITGDMQELIEAQRAAMEAANQAKN